MRILLLSYAEPGELSNGPSIILTNMAAGFKKRPGIDIRVGILRDGSSPVADAPPPPVGEQIVAFQFYRNQNVRSVMLRAALGGPLAAAESAFLAACAEESKRCDIVVWLGLSWDPVSLRLPSACSCPVVNHPTDSITLAEINRLPGAAQSLRIFVARRLETRVLNAGYTKAIYNSPQDARYAASLLPPSRRSQIVTLPIGIDTDMFHPEPCRSGTRQIRVVFSGVMNYRPNVDAALSLIRGVRPHIVENVEIRIIGRNPAPELVSLSKETPGVTVTGAVPNIADELRNSDIFVAPMVSGGGISNKVLEAMACGLPVVTTPLVADNFPDRPGAMIVATTEKEIAAAIDTLVQDGDLRSRLSVEASEYMRTGTWCWQARADRLLGLLKECAGR